MRSRTPIISKLAILVIISIIILFEAYAGGGITPDDSIDSGNSQSSSSDASKQVNEWMANQGSGSTNAPAGTQATTPDKQKIGLRGNVNVQSGNIASADYLSFNNAEMTGVKNFFQSGTDFLVSFVNTLTLGSLEIINGKNIEYKNRILKAEHADSLEDTEIYNGKDDDKIQIEHADLVISDTTEISGIDDTGFLVTNLAVEIYPKNGTVLNITDAAGNQFTVEAIGNDSKIIISKTIPPTHIIKSTLFKHTYGNITEAIIAVNTTKIEMGSNGIKCMDITPVATFWHNENMMKDFGINVPQDSHKYTLCLRKFAKEKFNETDGLVDYIDKAIILSGVVNYLRYPVIEGIISEYVMNYIYQGKANTTTAEMVFDKDMMIINDLHINILNHSNELRAITYAGHHKIEETGKRHDIITLKPHGHLIRHYSTSNIILPVFIKTNLAGVKNTLLQPNSQLGSSVQVYPPTQKTHDRLIRDLQTYYKERNLENEI